jgi:acyl-[acyl-carrier-protein]-phospholipid O-acyltransferase/long-chain-fatty-acid--[acyl-carrier-protein] ligase
MIRSFLRWLLRLLYGFRAYNEEALDTAGPVLLLPNHVSWWDWLLIGVCLEEDWRFVTSSTAAEVSWVHKRLMINRRTFPVDMNSPYAIKHVAEYLQKGGRLVLFPEGRLSCTGSLMKLFDGTGFLIFKTRPKVITAYLRGARRLPFSRNPEAKRWFPRLSVHFSPVLSPPKLGHVSATEGRRRLTDWLRGQMVRQQFETEQEFGAATVPAAILGMARQWPGRVVVQDVSLKELTYRRLLAGADLLAARWKQWPEAETPRVGVLLPNVNAMPVALLSLWAAGKVPAVLNYSVGPAALLGCARLAGLKRIITARSFIHHLNLDPAPFKAAGIEWVFLEEIRAGIRGTEKLGALLRGFFGIHAAPQGLAPEDTAVVLFTSGSEGEPKAVELTHRNLLANIRQVVSVVDLMETDRFFNALPLFHCFGLNVGLLLPLVRAVFVFLYVSPLHYRVVPSAFYNLNCTILLSTNTFLAGYGRKAHPYDFRTARYVFAGAEKLQESIASHWVRHFGVRILEGYGVTECGPVISVNVSMLPRHGSTGQFLPGIQYRLEPVEGVGEEGEGKSEIRNPKSGVPSGERGLGGGRREGRAGRLFVRGPNVMRGYLNPEANASFQALEGWYDTGDVVRVDEDGFVHILGRLKRFAKIGGEMVSLGAIEEALAGAFPQYGLKFAVAVMARPDEDHGERLIAVTNEAKLTLAQVRQAVQARGLGNLAVPRQLKVLADLPRLGTGKVDHRRLEAIV